MKTQICNKRSLALAAGATVLLGMLPFSAAQADTTGFLSPTAVGTFSTWNNSGAIANVNDGVGCIGDTSAWVAQGAPIPVGSRATAIIDLSSVPDGATIDSIDVQVCHQRTGGGAPGATFQTSASVDGAGPTDSGVDIVADPSGQAAITQNIPAGSIVKSGATTLEVGVVRMNNINGTRVFTLAAQVNFTPASGPTPPSATKPVPVFGPFGLLFTILGMGLVGIWQARRK